MKTNIIILALIFFSYASSSGQTFNLQLDHTTILVSDLETSSNFYKNILLLTEIETPWGVIKWGKFFSISNNQQLHLAKVDADSIKLNKWLHIAFTVQDFDAYLRFLTEKGIEYGNFAGDSKEPQIRPDGVKQIYFQDPDGYWIEINDRQH
jgi:lactoylglutathione lyase